MQPYFLPYLGYWSLVANVDCFVILDDVNYIKKGWINRNNFQNGDTAKLITLPIKNASQNRQIIEHELLPGFDTIINSINREYSRAPYSEDVSYILNGLSNYRGLNLADFLSMSLIKVSKCLGLETKFLRSSELEYDRTKRGQAKIIEICKICSAQTYVNLPGGKKLYDVHEFHRRGMKLLFVPESNFQYNRGDRPKIQNLSVADVVAYTGITGANGMIRAIRLN